MVYVNLAFRLTGSHLPVDHGYALYASQPLIMDGFPMRYFGQWFEDATGANRSAFSAGLRRRIRLEFA